MTRAAKLPLVLLLLLASLLSACGGSGDGNDAKAEALELAVQACNQAMTDESDLNPDDSLLEVRRQAADEASQASEADSKWAELAKATSDWAFHLQKLQDINADSPTFIEDMREIGAQTDRIKADIASECRRAKASGGDVDEALLNKF